MVPVFEIFNARIDVDAAHAISLEGCTEIVRESALEVDSGREKK